MRRTRRTRFMRRRHNPDTPDDPTESGIDLDALMEDVEQEEAKGVSSLIPIDEPVGSPPPPRKERYTSKVPEEEVEEMVEEQFTAPQPLPSQPPRTRTTAQQTEFEYVSTDKACSAVGQVGDPITLLEWQYKYYNRRVPQRALTAFKNYWPYLELRERTLPLPSVPEILNALQGKVIKEGQGPILNAQQARIRQANGKKDVSTANMLDYAFAALSDTIIILGRENGNTQVIIPGKSTTSYRDKRSKLVKNFVWTSSAEFRTLDLRDLKAYFQQEDATIASYFGQASFTTRGGIPLLRGQLGTEGGLRGEERGYAVDLSLCSSYYVALDYLHRVWMTRVGKTQKRSGYTILMFRIPRGGRPSVSGIGLTLEYLGKRTPKGSTQRSPTAVRDMFEQIARGESDRVSNPRQLPNRGRRRRRKVCLMPREF